MAVPAAARCRRRLPVPDADRDLPGWTLLAIPTTRSAPSWVNAGQTRVAAWREAGMICGTLLAMLLPVLVGGVDALHSSALALLWLLPAAMLAVYWLGHARPGGRDRGVCRCWACGEIPAGPRATSWPSTCWNALAGGTAATLFVIYTRDTLGLDERSSGPAPAVVLPGRPSRCCHCGPGWRAGSARYVPGVRRCCWPQRVSCRRRCSGDAFAFALVCAVTGATLSADIALPATAGAPGGREPHIRGRVAVLFGLWGMASKLALAIAAAALPLLGGSARASAGPAARVVPWL